MKNGIENIINEEFYFLIENFTFSQVEFTCRDGSVTAKYVNNYCAVTINYEYREAFVFVVISRLVDGRILPNPSLVHRGVIFNSHSLDDLVHLLAPKDAMQPAYSYGSDSPYYKDKDGLRLYVSKFANNLKKYGVPFFNGDFRLFDSLNEIVITRVEEYKRTHG